LYLLDETHESPIDSPRTLVNKLFQSYFYAKANQSLFRPRLASVIKEVIEQCSRQERALSGRQREAIAELQHAAASHRAVLELMYLGHALGISGARAEGQKVLEEHLMRQMGLPH
jgi:hypothetical protein